MTKEKQNELMNRISFALKDITLQQGFEILCKRISDLEKENEELKAQVEQLSNDNHVLKTSFITQQEQIEKMKCCSNCKHKFEPREKGSYVMPCEATEYKPCDRWELDYNLTRIQGPLAQ